MEPNDNPIVPPPNEKTSPDVTLTETITQDKTPPEPAKPAKPAKRPKSPKPTAESVEDELLAIYQAASTVWAMLTITLDDKRTAKPVAELIRQSIAAAEIVRERTLAAIPIQRKSQPQ